MNDQVAICRKGSSAGRVTIHNGTFEHGRKAEELGYVEAHYRLSKFDLGGECVEKDEAKKFYHLGGHPSVPGTLLDATRGKKGNKERPIKPNIHNQILGREPYQIGLLMHAYPSLSSILGPSRM